ncbi:hypothetical protein ACFL1B_04615 [Nanoarchaeota archaeon]
MEIKIDTSKDSTEDIKKMISFLQHFVNEQHDHSSLVPDASEGMFNIFDNDDNSTDSYSSDLSDKDEDDNFRVVSYD